MEGSTEIWQALKMSIEVIQQGDVETGKTILESMGCTNFKQDRNNKETKYVYDASGVRYDIPMYMFNEPKNLLTDDIAPSAPMETPDDNLQSRGEGQMMSAQSINQENINFANAHINSKQITFTVRLCVGGDLQMTEYETASIFELKQNLSRKLNNLDPTKIRILFKGKMLTDQYRINAPFPIQENDVVQAAFPSALYKPN